VVARSHLIPYPSSTPGSMMGEEEEWDLCALLGLPSLPEPWPSLPNEEELATWASQASSNLQKQVGDHLQAAVPDLSVDELTVDELCLEDLGFVRQLCGGPTCEGNADEGGYDSGFESIFSTLEATSTSSSPSPSSCQSYSPPSCPSSSFSSNSCPPSSPPPLKTIGGRPSLLASLLSTPALVTPSSHQLSLLLSTSPTSPSLATALARLTAGRACKKKGEGSAGRKKLLINQRRREVARPQPAIHGREPAPWDEELRIQAAGGGSASCPTPGRDHGRDGQVKKQDKSKGWSKGWGRVWPCSSCSSTFESSNARALHRRQEHQKHLICTPCSRAFPTLQKLHRHQRAHARASEKKSSSSPLSSSHPPRYACSHCAQKFAFKNSLTKHLSKGRCIILRRAQQNGCLAATEYKQCGTTNIMTACIS